MASFSHGYALLIGVNENTVPGYALPAVLNDVSRLEAILVHERRCAYPRDHVRRITGPAATAASISDGLKWIRQNVEKDDNATALIYYSGHCGRERGQGGGQYYLFTYGFDPDELAMTALGADAVRAAVEKIKAARLLVVLDCCHAAAIGAKGDFDPMALPPEMFVAGGAAVAASDGGKGLDALAGGIGRAALSSSTGIEDSYVRKDGTMSIFTFHLVEALTGHAQPQEGATEVLVSDIVSHVHRCVPKSASADWNGAQQHPDYRLTGNFAVALLLGGAGLAKGEKAPDVLASPADPSTARASGDVYNVNIHSTGDQAAIAARDIHADVIFGAPPPAKGLDIAAAAPVPSALRTLRPAASPPPDTARAAAAAVDDALRPIMKKLIDRAGYSAGRAQMIVTLSHELQRGADADGTQIAAIVAGLLAEVPDLRGNLEGLFGRAEFAHLASAAFTLAGPADPQG